MAVAPDPHLAVQTAIIAALAGSSDVKPLVADRVYDSPPGNPPFPYLTVGDGDTIADKADGGYDGADNAIYVHVWSQEQGSFNLAKRIAAAVKGTIDGAALDLGAGQRLVEIFHTETRFLRDPDGITSHAVVMFTAFTEPA